MDCEKIATEAVEGMTATDLRRFLVVRALVSDLYGPGHNPDKPLAKDSNLARAAARYKLDPARITAVIRAGLRKAKNKPKRKSQPAAQKQQR